MFISIYNNYFVKGDKFGEWEILNKEIIPHPKNREATVLCKCSCGFEKNVRCLTLVKGQSKSCFNCGHGKRGENNHLFKGYKEIPQSWFYRYEYSSKIKKNLEFEISIEDVYNLWIKQNKKCALTELDISFKNINIDNKIKGRRRFDVCCDVSIDRKDNNKGYLLDNIQLVHKDINMMKKEYDGNYFIKMCKLVASNFR